MSMPYIFIVQHFTRALINFVISFQISDDGTIDRQRVECTSATCGGGVFMAKHKDRHYCGKCHATLIEQKK